MKHPEKLQSPNTKVRDVTLLTCAMLLAFGNIAGSAEKPIKCIEPDETKGMSEAVVVEDVPLVHTMQMMGASADAALNSVERILKSAGTSLDAVCKLNVYVAEENGVAAVQKVLAKRFNGAIKPAMTFVVSHLPDTNAMVGMDAVAAGGSETPRASVENGIRTFAILPKGPKTYVSGMADTNGLTEATRKTLEKLTTCIGRLGLGKKDIVQLKAFLEPMSDAGAVRKEIADYFHNEAPPVVFVEWSSPKPNPPIEIELIAQAKSDQSNQASAVSYITPAGTTDSKVFKRVAQVN